MSKKQRTDFLIVSILTLVVWFVIFCFIGTIEPYIGDGTAAMALKVGAAGGAISFLLITAVMLSAHILAKRKLAVKIMAAVLWPLTLVCVLIGGAVCALPYQIFNIVKIAADKKTAPAATDNNRI